MPKELIPSVYSSTLGNLFRALPMVARQPLRKVEKVYLTWPTQSKSGNVLIPMRIALNAQVA
eukprot:2126036-Lingulodinium_polyedra.AAC.1